MAETNKKHKLLLLMRPDETDFIGTLENKRSPYTFVSYTGKDFSEESVTQFLREHVELDGVVVFNHDYGPARRAMEAVYRGKKILLDSVGGPGKPIGNPAAYDLKLDIPIRPSEFDRLVAKLFAQTKS